MGEPVFGAKVSGICQTVLKGPNGSKWGFAAMTTEWLAARLLNVDRRWTLLYYRPGRNEKSKMSMSCNCNLHD